MRKKKNEIGMNEEFMVCATIRYCVGRRTGASQAQAGYIAGKYYDKLSDERLEFTAEDIRNEIGDSLRNSSFNFTYDGTVSYEKRLPFEDFMTYISTLKNVEEELLSTSRIKVYCESYKDDAPKKFKTTKQECNVRSYLSQYDIDCLLPWQRLAALFDKKHYKKIHLNYNGEESEAIVIETYVKYCDEIKETPGSYRMIPWKYKKVYMDVERLKSGNIENAGYYINDYITSVENYNI